DAGDTRPPPDRVSPWARGGVGPAALCREIGPSDYGVVRGAYRFPLQATPVNPTDAGGTRKTGSTRMIGAALETAVDRLRASDPGWSRSRRALSAVLGIAIAVAVLVPTGQPLTVVRVGAIGAMMAAFAISDPEPAGQAVSLLLVFVVGAAALTAASLGQGAPPLDGVVFVLLIFVAVYAQRFGPRGIALG